MTAEPECEHEWGERQLSYGFFLQMPYRQCRKCPVCLGEPIQRRDS